MSENIRKMIDKVNDINNDIDSGVYFVYEQHPEFNSIGTPKEYSEYLKTIFPNSKVKNILYHGTDKDFDEFNDRASRRKFVDKDFSAREGIFLTNNRDEENVNHWGRNTKAVVINVSNPIAVSHDDFQRGIFPEGADLIYQTFDINKPKSLEFVLSLHSADFAIKSANKTHILGSKKDFERFKQFMKNKLDFN